MDRPPVTIQLVLQPDGNSVTGSAVDEAGGAREFAGWMGLVAALDTLLRDDESARATQGKQS
jgi:hypothetical protein